MAPQPAYNTVAARTTLAVSAPTMVASMAYRTEHTHQEPKPKPRKVEWSTPVREYVGRAFDAANGIPGVSPVEVTAKLKEIISFHAERGQEDAIDWATYPLPQALIIEDRRKVAAPSYASTTLPTHVNFPYGSTNTSSAHVSPPSKRKSTGAEPAATDSPQPPWRKTNLKDRITFDNGHKDKRQKKNESASSKLDQADLEKRRQRFNLGSPKTTPPWGSPRVDSDSDMATGPVIGTNMSLEKSYFRLTAPPKPETVRPQHVLEKTLDHLRKKWKEEKNYNYICNQFKSLRQDLTVQHIKNAFTVRVYETHARIALEKGDLGEYNQCQTQLKALYLQKLGGHPGEFVAYRILYFVYTCNKSDMNDLLAELIAADKVQHSVKHALEVRSSLALGNYHKFFRLYLEAPNMGAYLMDMFVERERLHALANISRAYVQIALRFLTDELGFENDDECRQFLQHHGVQHLVENKVDKNGTSSPYVKTKEGAAIFESLRANAFRTVDLKGQI